jgi:serine kinase of HPr protein (carbohydrate metabolism regulator)
VTETINIHATGLLYDGIGVLIRGPSGSGKSLLALDLLDSAEARGLKASLVGDDRLEIARTQSGLTMAPPKSLEGLIELRGFGIVSRPFTPKARIDLIFDLVDGLERMPESAEFQTELFEVDMLRCPLPRRGVIDPLHQLHIAHEALASMTWQNIT